MKVSIPATWTQRWYLEAWLRDHRWKKIGFGGARGGGKTYGAAQGIVLRRLDLPGTHALMLRQVQSAADENLGTAIRDVLRAMNISVGRRGTVVKWEEAKKRFIFPHGGIVRLGYCKRPDDWELYQGLQYADIHFAELGQFKRTAWDKLSGSNRGHLNAKMTADFNPGGIGHSWIKEYFINADTRPAGVLFIKSLLRDSMALLEMDPEYRDRNIATIQQDYLRKQWEDGDFDVVEGAFFNIDPAAVRKVEVPYYAELYAGVDAGFFPSAFAVVWVATWVDGEGKQRVHIWREVKRQKYNATMQADEALGMEKTLPMTPICRYADPAAWKRHENSMNAISASTAYAWAESGFIVTPSLSNARAGGWLILRTLMDNKVLTIDPSCRALLSEMESAIHDTRTDDIADACEDHLLDALRYILLSVLGIDFAQSKLGDYERGSKIKRMEETVRKQRSVLTKRD